MVPAVTEGGRSFKGAALYYLHDKRQAGESSRLTASRVAWAETVNLSTADPERAWRIMAHTAMSQADLKAAAGEKATGRKLTKPAYAYSLAWHPDEEVSKADQLEAARASLTAQGLDGYQALIVCHDDEPQAHVHIIVNRVHPETGKAATLSNNTLKLSKWAEAYEQKRGKIFCKKRVENNAKREQGDYIRSPRIPRPVFEFNKATGNDNLTADFVKTEQKQKDAQLYDIGRTVKDNHARQWEALKRTYATARQKITDHGDRLKDRKADEIKADAKPRWASLFKLQRMEREAFQQRENNILTRLWNAAAALRQMRRQGPDGDLITLIFAAMSSRERSNLLTAQQEGERRDLAGMIRAETREAGREVDRGTRADLAKLRDQYLGQCANLKTTQEQQRGEVKAAWQTRNAERKAALAPYRGREKKPIRSRDIGRSRSAEDHGRGSYRPR
jgi:Relaxase/Mobilisation nuclease domain